MAQSNSPTLLKRKVKRNGKSKESSKCKNVMNRGRSCRLVNRILYRLPKTSLRSLFVTFSSSSSYSSPIPIAAAENPTLFIWSTCWSPLQGEGGTPRKVGRGLQPTSQNPYPIYDQNLRFLLPYL